MSTATSPNSERTVLLWGSRWWLPHSKVPIPFEHLAQAPAMLAEAWRESGKAIRLVYQPDDLVSVPVPCPNGNRATVRMALAEEHPVVLHPGHVWGHEPILPGGAGFMTMLHYESRPALYQLVQQLQERGFEVVSAWPLATWLTALPPDLSESGAMTICAVHPDSFCLFRHAPDGQRSVQTGHGTEAVPALARHLQPVGTQPELEYVLFVTTSDELVESLIQRVPLKEGQLLGIFNLWDALAKPAQLPPHHPAQLLPPVPRITPRRAVLATTVLLFLGAMVSAGLHARAYQARVAENADRERQKVALRAEVDHLRSNAAEISALRTELAVEPGAPAARVLDQLAAAMGPGLVLRSVRVTAEHALVQGWIDPAAAAGLLPAWLAKLNAAGPVQWAAAGASAIGGAFQLEGRLAR